MTGTSRSKIKWRVERERSVICDNFERREGWVRTEGDDWNVFWASVQTIHALFNVNQERGTKRLADDQLVCHFPNHYELTRKDSMIKNMKRYVKDKQRQQKLSSATGKQRKEYESGKVEARTNIEVNLCPVKNTLETYLIPTSYLLPSDYSIFVEEFRKSHCRWIMKPANGCAGRGIFIVNKLDQIKKWSCGRNTNKEGQPVSYVVSRYIEKPLLIGGKKFDLRIYVLVTSFRPLRMYLGDGFARFCSSKYSCDLVDMNNKAKHLTNVSLQKRTEGYNHSHGGKWRLKHLKLYLEAMRGLEATQKLFDDINTLLVHSAVSM